MRATIAAFALAFASAMTIGASGGCGDSINRGWLVDRTRLLAARVEAANEPTRAALAPGEHGRITWLVGSPSAPPALGWAYAMCLPPAGQSADPRCPAPPLGASSGPADPTRLRETLAMELDVPSAEAVADARELLVVAAFCADEVPALDPSVFRATCPSGAEPLLASARLRLATAGPNANPAPPAEVRIGDVLLPESNLPGGAPCDGSLPVIHGPADLVYGFRAEDREAGESLLLSHTVTGGDLDHAYSTLESDEPLPKVVRVPFVPPSGGERRVLRVYVVVRDGRGGAAFSRLGVCVGP